MADAHSDTDLLRRYLRGDIDARQEAELERRAAADPDLRAAMDGVRTLPEHDHAASVSRMLAKAKAGKTLPRAKVRRLPRYWWAAAAALLFLATLVFLLPGPAEIAAPEVAMEQAPAPPPPVTRSEEPAPTLQPEPPSPAPPSPVAAPASAQKEVAPAPAEDYEREEAVVFEDEAVEEVAAEEIQSLIVGEDAGAPAPVATAPAPLARKQQSDVGVTRSPVRYLTGRVLDADGEPIPGASLRLPGQPIGPETDSLGAFRLNADAVSSELRVSAAGYQPETIKLTVTGEDIQVTLDAERPPLDNFDEAIGARETLVADEVTGELRRAELPGIARPESGFRKLRKRIEAERPADLPAGKVRVNFLVQPDGRLTDFEFRKGTPQATREYIREKLLRESNWRVVRGKGAVRVYMRINI